MRKNAVVTGASRGIGAQIARVLATRGANVALCFVSDSQRANAAALAEDLRAIGVRTICIQEDLAADGAAQRIISQALMGLNVTTIDILINNAALDPPTPTPASESDPSLFDRFMRVNARAPLELVTALVPRLPPSGGRIVSISSVLSQRPDVPFAVWAASKAALECLSRYWAMELASAHRLTSNVVAIGPTMTNYHRHDPPEVLAELAQLPSAAKRLATPDDIAQIVAFLASDAGRWINGEVIQGNGGMVFG
ncbi:SDR family NAD(P)-dependent oxidoreductase [Aspergillus fijiensis CBS 313.89]|uniref:NAD(P)-binding protein n=1 Tax=Aspergillus fijiensis CBS 313.89 TaxID=1448319 RepID=A0A8G1RVG6_9EURO|nr:NAD(P)-binding protein [Aspergillus fijiensis CBS 313.89]RAK79028.1 NAD(P)-binding protein [Aspergillus fijiensis CBS 313.89]